MYWYVSLGKYSWYNRVKNFCKFCILIFAQIFFHRNESYFVMVLFFYLFFNSSLFLLTALNTLFEFTCIYIICLCLSSTKFICNITQNTEDISLYIVFLNMIIKKKSHLLTMNMLYSVIQYNEEFFTCFFQLSQYRKNLGYFTKLHLFSMLKNNTIVSIISFWLPVHVCSTSSFLIL